MSYGMPVSGLLDVSDTLPYSTGETVMTGSAILLAVFYYTSKTG